MKIIPLALSLLAAVAACASEPTQPVESDAGREARGTVRDAETKQPLPFANIGVRELGLGTVADENGHYRLALATSRGAVTVSAIGYMARTVALDELVGADFIDLARRAYLLEEQVVVRAEAAPAREQILGKDYGYKGHGVGFASAQLGAEIGARIRIEKPTLIRSANFVISHTRADGFLFRVNLYDFKDGRLGDNLLKQNVILPARTEKGVMTADLSEYLIVVENDVLLALEWVKGDRQDEVPPVMFRSRRGGSEPMYHKRTSQAAFETMESMRLGFFLVGQRLK